MIVSGDDDDDVGKVSVLKEAGQIIVQLRVLIGCSHLLLIIVSGDDDDDDDVGKVAVLKEAGQTIVQLRVLIAGSHHLLLIFILDSGSDDYDDVGDDC